MSSELNSCFHQTRMGLQDPFVNTKILSYERRTRAPLVQEHVKVMSGNPLQKPYVQSMLPAAGCIDAEYSRALKKAVQGIPRPS
jgi:hypothetical protein